MAEIITIPNVEVQVKKKPSKKPRYLLIAGLFAVFILICVLVSMLRTYDDYTVQNSIDRSDVPGAGYVEFENNILKYSADGAFYSDYNGNLLWNETYEMTNPTIEQRGSYLMIYDRKGTRMLVVNTAGAVGNISTTMPIISACVADQGTVAALTSQDESYYLNLYDLEGNLLASGRIYVENTGYPIALALSPDAKDLAVSIINIKEGDIKTTLSIYNFDKEGQEADNNIVATFSYQNQIIPRITYLDNGELVAFGDTETILFTSGTVPKAKKEIFQDGNILSVFYNENTFGMIYDDTDEDGNAITVMEKYTASGRRMYQKTIDATYDTCNMQENGEVLLKKDGHVWLYSKHGILKYDADYEGTLHAMISCEGSRGYIMIWDNVIEEVRLK